MALDFFGMMKQEQEKQQAQNKLAKEPKKEIPVTEPDAQKKPTAKSCDIKKEKPVVTQNKILTFDEQYQKITNPQLKALVDYLMSLEDMKEKMEHPDVSIDGMYKYCESQARRKAVNGVYFNLDNNELYGWGRHYYDEHGKVAK